MFVIGLTGGIGTGKSTVARMLGGLGAAVIDADLVGHEAYATDGPLYGEIVAAFGREVLGDYGTIDRRKLAALVFNDPGALQRLAHLVQPWIYGRIVERLKELDAAGTRVAVVEVVGLLEAGWQDLFDEIWVTVASPATAIQRLKASRGLTEEQVRQRMSAQLSNDERIAAADVIIDTEGTLEAVRRQVESHWADIARRTKEGDRR